jgi:hypothetical protein
VSVSAGDPFALWLALITLRGLRQTKVQAELKTLLGPASA